MSLRPIDRKLLASFIEYAANGVVTNAEWSRFATNHYGDTLMEKARVECVRILCGYPNPRKLGAEDRLRLHGLARRLREST